MLRSVPPVVTSLSPAEQRDALIATLAGDPARDLRARLASRCLASDVVLTDSGTSALVEALRLAVPQGGVVALPGWVCIDVSAAVEHLGLSVRLYDLEPRTLGPDASSLERVLRAGVDAVVVAHLFGVPANMAPIVARCHDHGAVVIEDAAQWAGGMLDGRPLGGFGDLAVLSFGRGKGVGGGGGGALLARPEFAAALTGLQERLGAGPAAWSRHAVVALQSLLARPSLYALPRALPFLHLGEMVYHPAHAATPMSRSAAGLVLAALPHVEERREQRACRAATLVSAIARLGASLRTATAPPRALPGHLRLPLLAPKRLDVPSALGVVRAYPATTAEHPTIAGRILSGAESLPGSRELRECAITVPVHERVGPGDLARLQRWIASLADAERPHLAPVLGPSVSPMPPRPA